jgi:hypothetical protein
VAERRARTREHRAPAGDLDRRRLRMNRRAAAGVGRFGGFDAARQCGIGVDHMSII